MSSYTQDNDSARASGLRNPSGDSSNFNDRKGLGANSEPQNPTGITNSSGEPNILGSGHWKHGPGESENTDQSQKSSSLGSSGDDQSRGQTYLHGHGPDEAAKANCGSCTRDQSGPAKAQSATDQSRGQGGTGQRKTHLHGHGPDEAAKANCELCQCTNKDQSAEDTEVGGYKTATDSSPRRAEQPKTTQAYRGAAGDHAGDTTNGRYAGGGTDTLNQYPTTEGHHQRDHPDGHNQEGGAKTSFKVKATDKIQELRGGAEIAAGKLTDNPELYQKGQQRVAAAKNN